MTDSQHRLMEIPEQTRCLTINHVTRLLTGWKYPHDAVAIEHILRQLRHIGKLIFLSDSIVALPYTTYADPQMLDLITVSLDISSNKIEAIATGHKPFHLCFLASMSGQEDDLQGFGLFFVPAGKEQKILWEAESTPLKHTVVFVLEALEQQAKIRYPFDHYFAIRKNDTFQYRFCKGVART